MLSVIGLMIGFYILMRCIEIITINPKVTKTFAVITFFTTIFFMIGLLTTSVSQGMK